MSPPLSDHRSQRADHLKTGNVVGVGLDIHEQLSKPRRVFAEVEPADQGGTVGVGACEDVEQLAGSGLAEDSDDSDAEVI